VTVYYVDTSVLGHAILPDGLPGARRWLDQARQEGHVLVSSRLAQLELTRLARRETLDLAVVQETVARINLLAVDEPVLREAEQIRPHVKTLDAIHLGAVIAFDADVTVASHDTTMLRTAADLGFTTCDPLATTPPAPAE
jgi:predicted nucleic acid-binding protein